VGDEGESDEMERVGGRGSDIMEGMQEGGAERRRR